MKGPGFAICTCVASVFAQQFGQAACAPAPWLSWASSQWKRHNVSYSQPSSAWAFDAFKRTMEQGSQECDNLGISAIVMDADGNEVFRHTTGRFYCTEMPAYNECSKFADHWSSTTVHPIFSGTKIVTAAMFLTATVTTRKTTLDEPFYSSLPDIFGPGTHGSLATPRMVMSHTAGFVGPVHTMKTTDCYAGATTLEECVHQLAHTPLQHQEGEQFEYSDLAWEILGLLLERLTGRSIEQNFDQYFRGPLKMANSSFECPQANSSATRSHAASGLCTTVDDLSKFVRMMSQGGRTVEGIQLIPYGVTKEIYSSQTGEARLFGDDINYFRIPNRCASGAGSPANFTVLDYGLGAAHYLGFKSEAWMHSGTLGVLHFVSPGRYSAVFSTGYPVEPALDRHLRTLAAFENDNFAAQHMCPTSIDINGPFPVKPPIKAPWTSSVLQV